MEKELIAPLEGDGRQRPYRLTARGTAALDEQLQNMRRIASIGLRRLQTRMKTTIVSILLRLYPKAWRTEYGAELRRHTAGRGR